MLKVYSSGNRKNPHTKQNLSLIIKISVYSSILNSVFEEKRLLCVCGVQIKPSLRQKNQIGNLFLAVILNEAVMEMMAEVVK